jgi:ADP-heptose:LPS heptosyltransferase
MYTRRVARPRELRPRHSVENQWDLLTALGIEPPDRARFPVRMAIDPAAATAVSERLNAAGIQPADRVVVIHVSAGNPFRRWPLAHFVDLTATLVDEDTQRRIIVTSGPSEWDAAARVIADARRRLGVRADRVVSCGEFSIAELRALFDRASLYIGGDSGPLHVAATTRVPIVGLYGPTLPVRSAPWRDPALPTESVDAGELPCRPCDQRVCAPGDFRCLTTIQPRQVMDAAERAAERKN